MGQHLLDCAGSLSAIPHWTGELVKNKQLTAAQATRIAVALELGQRALRKDDERPRLENEEDVCAWAQGRVSHLEHEEVWLLCLDSRHRLLRAACIAQGGITGCSFEAKDVLRAAVRAAASAIVLVHNHPSGDPQPSPQDVQTTRVLASAWQVKWACACN